MNIVGADPLAEISRREGVGLAATGLVAILAGGRELGEAMKRSVTDAALHDGLECESAEECPAVLVLDADDVAHSIRDCLARVEVGDPRGEPLLVVQNLFRVLARLDQCICMLPRVVQCVVAVVKHDRSLSPEVGDDFLG